MTSKQRVNDIMLEDLYKAVYLAKKQTLSPKNFEHHELVQCALMDLRQCRTLLADLHTRMIDVYDGAPDSTNRLPFTGGDIRDIEEVLR